LKKMIAYKIRYTTADNCGPITTSLSVTFTDRKGHDDDEDDHDRHGKGDMPPLSLSDLPTAVRKSPPPPKPPLPNYR